MGAIKDLADAVYRDFNTANVPSSGVYQPAKALIRALFEEIDASSGGVASAHCATAVSATGEVYRTAPLISAQMYTIRDVDGFLESPAGGTWDIVLDRLPVPVPTTVTVIAVGKNQVNNLAPQVDGTWTLAPVTNDPFRFTLVGSVFGPMKANGGVAYVPGTTVDASPIIQSATSWARSKGGALWNYPPLAGFYLGSGPMRILENSIYNMNGSFVLQAGYYDMTAASNNTVAAGTQSGALGHGNISKSIVEDFWIFGNRGNQVWPAGQHQVNLGTSSHPEKIQHWIYLNRVHMRGAAGYTLSGDNENAQIHFFKSKGSMKWGDGDLKDRKNPLNRNAEITLDDESLAWPALGGQGTNLQMIRGMPDPFRATPPSNTVLCNWNRHNFHVGDRVIITEVAQGNGVTIPATPVTIASVPNASQFTFVGSGASISTAAWGGRAVKVLKCIAVNGITTTNGQKYIDIPRSTDAASAVGEKAVIAGAGTVNGIAVDGVWDVYEAVSATVLRLARVDVATGALTGSSASSSGTGGGSNMTYLCAHISPGDRVADMRSIRSTLRGVKVEGEFYGRAGLQQRGGLAAAANGSGGDFLSIDNFDFEDFTPAWIATKGGGGTALAADGTGLIAKGLNIKGPGLRNGVATTSNARGAQISAYYIDGPRTGIALRGNNHSIGKGKVRNAKNYGVSLFGGIEAIRLLAATDPFVPVAVSDPRVLVNAPGHGVTTINLVAISDISQTNPVVVTTSSPHGLAPSYAVGIRAVAGMTEMNGRAGRYTVLSPTTFSLPIDATGFTPYAGGGFVHNRRVTLSGFTNGSGIILFASNSGLFYLASYVDADHFVIDASQDLSGAGSIANSTDAFGGDSVFITYGTAAVTATNNIIDGVEFEHDDVSNTAVCIGHGDEPNLPSNERGTAAGTIVKNCVNRGYTGGVNDYDTSGILGPNGTSSALYKNNVGIFNQGAITQRFTASGNYAGHPYAISYEAKAWPGGGGGGSGRRGAAASARSGGTGGNTGLPVSKKWAAADLTFPVAMVIGAGGAGGAAVTTNDTGGNDGVAGGDTTFATLRALGGTKGWGGGIAAISPTNGNGSNTGASLAVQNAGQLFSSATGVGGAIASTAANVQTGPMGYGGGPGGSGGSLTTANVEALGIQATWANWADPTITAPVGPAAAGVDGAAGVNSALLDMAGYGGGGGGPKADGVSRAGNGGAGGRGSGGGGGGASANGANSGAGGAGGGGQISVTMTF